MNENRQHTFEACSCPPNGLNIVVDHYCPEHGSCVGPDCKCASWSSLADRSLPLMEHIPLSAAEEKQINPKRLGL